MGTTQSHIQNNLDQVFEIARKVGLYPTGTARDTYDLVWKIGNQELYLQYFPLDPNSREIITIYKNHINQINQYIIKNNLPTQIPISNSDLYQAIQEVYQKIQKHSDITIPIEIDGSFDKGQVDFIWNKKKKFNLSFVFSDNQIHSSSQGWNGMLNPSYTLQEVDQLINDLKNSIVLIYLL